MGDDDSSEPYGLGPILLEHKPVFEQFFSVCRTRLSDYSFANTAIWRDAIHLRWGIVRGFLCVFANGDGGLTLLFPPTGQGDFAAAARESLAICEEYNRSVGYEGLTRVEYVTEDLLGQFAEGFAAEPMSGDYVYATQRMIDLDGGDLSSKRQSRNRFARRYEARTERFGPEHEAECLRLLELWHEQHVDGGEPCTPSVRIKRAKEEVATAEAIRYADRLGLTGMVLFAGQSMVGFTFGEKLDAETCSIVIEKTDRDFTGSAQYIFSEFCRQFWPETRWCNVGDDWEIPALAWTKQSYRPAFRVPKWIVRPLRRQPLFLPAPTRHERLQLPAEASPALAPLRTDRAGPRDLDELEALEAVCFQHPLALKRRQLRYLLRSPRAAARVIRQDGRIVAEAVMLCRRTPRGTVGRIYSLAVGPQQRRRGLGKAILDGCLEALRGDHAVAVVLEVDVENAPAIALYERAGFRKVRRLSDYYGSGKDAWKMRLELAEGAGACAAGPAAVSGQTTEGEALSGASR